MSEFVFIMTCWLSGERSLPFGLLVLFFGGGGGGVGEAKGRSIVNLLKQIKVGEIGTKMHHVSVVSRRLVGELIVYGVYGGIRRPSVVNIFKRLLL